MEVASMYLDLRVDFLEKMIRSSLFILETS